MSALDTLAPARTTGDPPTDEKPAEVPSVLTEPKSGGPNPFAVVGAALAAGVVLAKWIAWRGHGRTGG